MVSIAILTRTIQLNPLDRQTLRAGRGALLVSAALMLPLGLSSLDTIPLLGAVVLLLLVPVFFALRAWLKGLDQ